MKTVLQQCLEGPATMGPTIQSRFERFDSLNPDVYMAFRRFAEEARNAGATRIGAKFICERIRWEVMIESKGESFKLNNNYPSRYARKLIAEQPWFKPLFELRELKA